MKKGAPCTVPYFSAVRSFFPPTEFFIPARVEWAVTEIAALTGKVTGVVGAVFRGPWYPVLPPETAEDKK
jgi:hypothetical protein